MTLFDLSLIIDKFDRIILSFCFSYRNSTFTVEAGEDLGLIESIDLQKTGSDGWYCVKVSLLRISLRTG